MGVRALGRLERPDLVPDIQPLLGDSHPDVRAEAANAVAQALFSAPPTAALEARKALLARLEAEREPPVRGEICAALGRLPYDTAADVQAIERVLAAEAGRTVMQRSRTISSASPLVGVTIGWGTRVSHHTLGAVGALRGLESLARLRGKVARLSPETRAALVTAATSNEVMVRRLSVLVLNQAGGAEEATVTRASRDVDEQVRRLAMASPTTPREVVLAGLHDLAPMVRYEALRVYGRRWQSENGCAPVVASVKDPSTTVALLAVDLLGGKCAAEDGAVDLLSTVASSPERTAAWHRPAHALVSLARIAPERARSVLPQFLASEPWQNRVYAAATAAQLKDEAALRALAADRSGNVREAAVSGLAKVVRHGADPIYREALDSPDPQLVMTAARALEGTPDRPLAAQALATALAKLTAGDSDNSRDPRMAILDRLAELGSAAQGAALEPLLVDPDGKVAARAAEILAKWDGKPRQASPRPRDMPAVPTEAALDRLVRTKVKVTMEGGGTFEISLLSDLAPLSCARFVELASSGYYNGLTFHRIVPNFVIQGGSPGANEFWGNSRFMPDEVGRVMQARGTVGTSTRGRDTGDAQFYVNLVDLPRLDHDYTIFGEVTAGMDVVDGIVEGDTIRTLEIRVRGK